MGRHRRKRKRRPRGFSDGLWKWPYRFFFWSIGVGGSEKREILNYFAWCISVSVAAGIGLGGGAILAQMLDLGIVGGVLAGVTIAFLAFDLTAEYMMRDRFYRP